MLGITILFAFQFLGMIMQIVLHIPLPSNVIGLILFIACLFLRIIRVEWVEKAAELLLKHMMLFFTPYIVGSMVFFQLFKGQAATIIVGLIGSTFAVLLVTGWMMNWLDKEKKEVDHDVE